MEVGITLPLGIVRESRTKKAPGTRMGKWYKRLRFAAIVVVLLALAALWHTYGTFTLNHLLMIPLTVRSELPDSLDVEIIHGGENPPNETERLDWAIAMHREHAIANIIVSGNHYEAIVMRNYLIRKGVHSNVIYIENGSHNTWENAINSAKLCRKNRWRKIAIETSPFHSRRCDLVWRKVAPDLLRYSTSPHKSRITDDVGIERWKGLLAIFREYVAIPVYWWRGRLSFY